METFLVIGMCVLCYELCVFLSHCNPNPKDREELFDEKKQNVFTVSRADVVENSDK